MSSKEVKIKDLVELINGYPFSPEDWEIHGLPIIRIQNLNNEAASYNCTTKVISDKYKIKSGDIIIAWAGTLGVHEWSKSEDGLLNQHLFKVKFKTDDINKDYFKYVIQQALIELESKAHGLGLKHLKKAQIDNYTFSLPDLLAQERSVKVLNSIELYKKKRQHTIQLLDEYLLCSFVKLFGDPILNTLGWNVQPLSSFGDWSTGGTPPKKIKKYYKNGTIPWYTSGELNEFYTSASKVNITEDAIIDKKVKFVPAGSLMIGMYDTAALKNSISTVDCTCNQAIAFAELDDQIDPIFVQMVIQIGKEFYFSKRKGVRQKNLNLSFIKAIEIIVPPKELQEKFHAIFDTVQKQKQAYTKSNEYIKEILAITIYKTFEQKHKLQKDEIDILIEDDIKLELFLNTVTSSDFESEELYKGAMNRLYQVLDRTKLANSQDEKYIKGLIQHKVGDKIVLETNREYKYRILDETI